MPVTEREFVREDGVRVRVRRSTRRTRTVDAAWRDGVAVVSIPARLSRREEERWVEEMLGRMLQRRRRPAASDTGLMQRARELSARYLDGRADPASVRWADNQIKRWGSATAASGSIRLSAMLQQMPQWVVDHVLVHELAHLVADDGHGPRFRALAQRYPRHAEAEAFLAGVTWARHEPWAGVDGAGSDGSHATVPASAGESPAGEAESAVAGETPDGETANGPAPGRP